jgi:uncharacterized protein involved in oxidation of intracellular sulfur|tara:strand:+ start:1465 stop:1818 length:354 start_codon:yes stop_codon:yes gene_type:complete
VDKTLFVINDPPYGSERSYNGLRMAGSLAKRDKQHVRVFLIGDAVSCAKAGQVTPNGYYKIENMLLPISNKQGEIGVCGSCMDARGITASELTDGCYRSSMEELTDWEQWADKVLVF